MTQAISNYTESAFDTADTTKCTCSNCMHSSNDTNDEWICGLMKQKSRIYIHASSYCCWHEPEHSIIVQDPATKCIDPSDKEAVIRALRIEKNGLLCLIDGVRDDVECAHRNVQGALKQHNSERLKRAKRALENVIECMGVRP